MPENKKITPLIHVVGVEPEGPDPDIPPLSGLLGKCRLLCGGKRHLEKVRPFVPEDSDILAITNNIPEVLLALGQFVERGEKNKGIALVLATGDPLYYGIGRPIAERIPAGFLNFVPATTLIQRAFSLMCEPWDGVAVASIHSRRENPIVLSEGRWAFYTDGSQGPRSLVGMAEDQGFDIVKMTVLEEIGLPGERLGTFEKVTLSTEYPYEFKSLNIVVMKLNRKKVN